MPSTQTVQVPAPSRAADVPMAATGILMHEYYVKTIGRLAYVLGVADG